VVAPLVLGGAWLATHWLLRESGVWRDRNTDEVRAAQRDADNAFRLAVDPRRPRAAPVRPRWLDHRRFVERRTRLHALQYEATRLREKPMLWSLLLVVGANVVVFWALAAAAANGRLTLARSRHFAQAAVGTSMIAFGGLNWALDGSLAPVGAVLRLDRRCLSPARCLPALAAAGMPAREIRFRNSHLRLPRRAPVLDHFDLTIPPGSSLAIVGQNGAGKHTLANSCAGLTTRRRV